MPKRSNSFQRLVALLHGRLKQGWTIYESHMFSDLVTGEPREVDVVAQYQDATYPIFLSIECTDCARPADVTWVEGMAQKHAHLPTSKLVLWSRSGFTKAAYSKAPSLKIEMVSQAEAPTVDWAHMARKLVDSRL